MRVVLIALIVFPGTLVCPASDFSVSCQAVDGSLTVAIDESAPFTSRPVTGENDVFFPDGRLLAHLQYDEQTVITLSFAEAETLSEAEQEALYAVSSEGTGEPSRHALWRVSDRRWIVLRFVSPSERVLTAQTFAGGHPLAVVFWFPREHSEGVTNARARAFLEKLEIEWVPAEALRTF